MPTTLFSILSLTVQANKFIKTSKLYPDLQTRQVHSISQHHQGAGQILFVKSTNQPMGMNTLCHDTWSQRKARNTKIFISLDCKVSICKKFKACKIEKNKNQSETTLPMYNKLENCHHTFCKLIDSSKTDLQPFLDDENRYVLERKKRGKNMPSPKGTCKMGAILLQHFCNY